MNIDCPCKKKKCERHGNCDACRVHHAESKRKRPVACERDKKALRNKDEKRQLCLQGMDFAQATVYSNQKTV